jgi:hypothetical protein
MPTLAIIGPFRFYFFSGDGAERAHVHVGKDKAEAKFWLNPVEMVYAVGFKAQELRRVRNLVEEHAAEWLEAWNEYFGN